MSETPQTPIATETPPQNEEKPWYRKEAERPKLLKSFRIFKSFIIDVLERKYPNSSSSFMRYLCDCYSNQRLATDLGFQTWLKNGEKFY